MLRKQRTSVAASSSRCMASDVSPDGFGGVVLGRIFRQGVGVPPTPLGRQPILHLSVEVIRGIVVNVVEGPRIISPHYLPSLSTTIGCRKPNSLMLAATLSIADGGILRA